MTGGGPASIVRQPVQGMASATGAVTLTFPAVQGVSPGASMRVTATVVDSAQGTNWSVLVNGDTRGTMLGASGFGPFDVASTDQVQLTTTNANPSQIVHGWLTGYAQLNMVPAAPPAQINAVATTSPIVPVGKLLTSAGTTTLVIPIQPYYRSLIYTASAGFSQGTVTATGNVTGVVYSGTVAPSSNTIVPIFTGEWDTQLTISDTGGGVGQTIWIGADQAIDLQNVLALKGGIQTTPLRSDQRNYPIGTGAAFGSVNGSGTLVTAPGVGNRLLLLSLTCVGNNTPAANTALNLSGTIAATVVVLLSGFSSSTGSATAATIVWPAGILLDANTAITFATAGGTGTFEITAVFDTVT